MPTVQAGADSGVLGVKIRNYFSNIFNPENNWVIALSIVVAIAVISGGWLIWQWKKDDKQGKITTIPTKQNEKDNVVKK